MAVKPIPEGYTSITPYLVIKGAVRAMDWYKEALEAEEIIRMPGPDGRLLHGEIRIGDSVVMVCDEFPEMGTDWRSPETLKGVTGAIWLYSDDCDALYNKAVAAGAKGINPPADMFWGDRHGSFVDPFGHSWRVATHKEDVAPEEMARRQQKWLAEMAARK